MNLRRLAFGIAALRFTADEFLAMLDAAHASDDVCASLAPAVVVSGHPTTAITSRHVAAATMLTTVIIAEGQSSERLAPIVDLFAPDAMTRDDVEDTVAEHPQAAVTLALLLRGRPNRDVAEGLIAESAAYSVLQGGPEFARWRATRAIVERVQPEGVPVIVERTDDVLNLTLNRPHVRNALNRAMRDELFAALCLADTDRSLHVELRANGPTFCSGGDLDEFGSRRDPASAHLVRLARSLGWALHRVADRTTAFIHGSCAGSGVELAAFCARVVAHPDTTFALPEVQLGLIPGAGGTVSIPARIGRHRTALLALRSTPIDVVTAQGWGLIDAVLGD